MKQNFAHSGSFELPQEQEVARLIYSGMGLGDADEYKIRNNKMVLSGCWPEIF